ncbi:MAG: exodeoxyribonuclease VII large subunit [Marinilabilia sp.]
MGQENTITLFQLNQRIRGIIDDAMLHSLWVTAEISELRVNRNGHCYIDLIEKDEKSDQLRARSRALIWAQNYRMLKAYFESATGQPLTKGLKVLVKVAVQFQEVYGLSLIISDIDPSYTMGDLARKRREVLMRLEEEGVLEMNRELDLPPVIQKIAVISSPTAAGYGDFINQLENNPYHIRFYYHLFPAVMQGDRAEASITAAFDRVFEHVNFFDAVVLIRGGGASVDLMCFDGYWVAFHIAQFPLPVITGIGHERDESVADIVANTRMKTPTAVAAFLIERAGTFLQVVDEKAAEIAEMAREAIQAEKKRTETLASAYVPLVKMALQKRNNRLERQVGRLPVSVSRRLGEATNRLKRFQDKAGNISKQIIKTHDQLLQQHQQMLNALPFRRISRETEKLGHIEQTARLNDPKRLLERGYSLTYLNGNLVKNVEMVNQGDEITTRLHNGVLAGQITRVEKDPQNKNPNHDK